MLQVPSVHINNSCKQVMLGLTFHVFWRQELNHILKQKPDMLLFTVIAREKH